MQEAQALIRLKGSVERVTFYNPRNGFSVVRVRIPGRRDPMTVVGTLPAVQPGETLIAQGAWDIDPLHGEQFKAAAAEVHQPSEREGLVQYLGSGLIRQIGPVLASRIVATFGMSTLEVLDANPERVREVPGIGAQRASSIAAAWANHRALRAVVSFLAEHHLDTRFAPRLLASFGPEAPKILAANPYRLVGEVRGLGFSAADRLGRHQGVREASPARLQAAVYAAMLRATELGHTRQDRDQLIAVAADGAGVEPALLGPSVDQLIGRGILAHHAADQPPDHVAAPLSALPLFAFPGEPPSAATEPMDVAVSGERQLRLYEPAAPAERPADLGLGLRGLVRAEADLADRIISLSKRSGYTAPQIEQWLDADTEARTLSQEQREAVIAGCTSGCVVLTGGPGVGKTTTVRTLVRCLAAQHATVALTAPTGKAAQRLSAVTGHAASTIHRLLGAAPQGFRHGPREPLPVDVVIADECSMLDTQLARSLVRALPPHARLILVGDADQLPSIGPGQVLRDLIASGRVPCIELRTIFRQAAESQIILNAHRIRRAELPLFAGADLLPRGADCILVPAPAARAPEIAARWAASILPQALGAQHLQVQALAPLTRVCQSVNALLQQQLNPERGQAEHPHGALALRTGDRVIQTRNNYTLGVFNGDCGVIRAIDGGIVTVDFDEARVVEYQPGDLLDLEHAYCLTVHRSQGSEWAGVVLLASSSYGAMLSRNLLYTAITRARRAVVVVGDYAAIETALTAHRESVRQTGLLALLASGPELPDAH